jgi:hypothetical protein
VRRALLAAALGALPACSGGGSGGDIDAAPFAYSGPCAVSFGHSFILDHYDPLPTGQGLDITGDGVPDNALGYLQPVLASAIGAELAKGDVIGLLDFTGWDGVSDTAPGVNVDAYVGADADLPPDPSNDFSGNGTFLITDTQLDVTCKPVTRMQHASLDRGLIVLFAPVWRFTARYLASLNMADFNMRAQMTPDLKSFDGIVTTAFTLCAMSRTYLPGIGSLLDQVVALGKQPDIDVDGDGLETVVADGHGVTACIDGDGTMIAGADCVCSPRITDGYSMSLHVHGVPARIVGVTEIFP